MTDARNADEDIPQDDTAAVRRPDVQPDTQGEPLLEAELGEQGQGDLGEGDDHPHSGEAPEDLRSEGPAGAVHETSVQDDGEGHHERHR